MSATPPVPQIPEPQRPRRWWRRVNWSVVLRVPTALAASGAAMLVLPLLGLVRPMPAHEGVRDKG